jgi:hypothetical protein
VPVLLAVPVLPFSADPFERPAPIRATVARAAGDRSFYSCLLDMCEGALTAVLCGRLLVTAASLDPA